MHAWLKRAVAGLLSAGTLLGGGLLMAGTANADEIRMPDIGKTITSLTASAATTYPRELVNGGFDYLPDGGWKTVDAPSYMTNAYTSVDPNNGQYMRNAKHSDADLASWVDWPGFDQSKFAWKTDQKGGHDQGGLKDRAEAVELQQDSMDGNTYAEMVASEPGRTIYQNLATIPGTLYKIRLKHTSLCKDNVDQMQVVINGTPIEMTRVAANGKAGDKVGEKSKTIGTRVTNENRWHHSDQWETYEGYYVIPDGQTTTRFGFKAVNYLDPTKGNLLDDVTFARAYKLSYDKNASDATGKVPSDETADTVRQTKARTTGTVKTVADENVRYGSLANGDFSYPSFSDIQENEQGTYADLRTFLKSDDGTLWYNMSVTDLSKYGKIGQIPGFDSSRFAWSSTENGSRVELQQDRNTKNTYAEIVAQQDNTSIYQNVSTGNGGVLYKIRLKHASRQSSHADKMQVLVGSDTAHATPVEMTRVTSNGHGDKVGGKSTTITTKVSNTDPRDHGSQWETYEGYYQVPEGQKNTVFMFKSLEGFKEYETLPGNNVGNLVDDIEFSRSYKLTYDKNASDATGKVPSNQRGKENAVEPAESKTTGNVKTVADNTSNLPDHLVNGTFDYRGNEIINENQRVYGDTTYLAIISAKTGVIGNPLHSKLDNWDSGKFGWRSNDATAGVDTVEVQRRNHTPYPTNAGNVWGEIAAATQGKYLYQDIDTANTSDAMYTVRLKHASRNKDARDSMQVLVGAPGREKPVTMRRTIANAGDKAGEESTTITSTGTGQDDQWDTYEGTVLVPRGQDVTRFTFKSVADSNSAGRPDSAEGNLIDDVVFTKAYQLTYDANGGVKTRTSQIDYTTGGETRGKVKTVRDSPAPPAGQEKIVNGDFEYSGTGAGLSDSPFNYVSLSQKSYYYKDSRNVNHRVALPAGFDAKRFAWKSDQTGKDLGNPPYEQAGDVQVWNRYDGSNHYAELTAAQAGSAIYQDIDTESDSDVQYIVSLRHASLNASHLDSMQVLIGAPGHETPVTMTRVTANGYGDKVGESSDTIATRVSNPKPADREDSDHTGQWETYTGTVTVPAGRPVTRFTFRNVSSKSAWNGNLIDDIAFTKARRLDYDANGGTKAQASQIGYRTDATQGAVETVASKTLPTELVNGSFDYLLDGGWDTISPVGRGGYADDRGWGRFTSVDPASGEYIQNAGQNPATFDSTGKWVKWPGFDAAKFGWASDQKGGQPQGGVGLTDRPNAVELQQDSVTGNTYAEIVGSERGKAILQKIDTQHDSDTVYTVRFDHASLSKEHADSMQVLVNGKPVTMTRVTSNKAGDEQGWTGTSITTHATNTNRFQHDGQWATYEGKVTIPANTPVSTFTFKALNAVDPTKGNLIDNLTFKIAYRLSYDANGGTKKQASRISSKTFGKAKTARTEAIASRASGDELAVNGGFDVPKWGIAKEGQGLPWIYVYADKGVVSSYYQYANGQNGTKMPGLTTSSFAWRDVDAIGGHQAMELHREKDGNTAADVHAGRTVAQTVATTPGAAYTFSIRHSGRSKGNAGGVTLLAGPDKDHLTPVKLTRTTVSKTGAKYGDKTGDVGTVAYTHSDSADATEGSHDPWDHSDDWESYEGTVIIPAGQSRTMIAYRGVAKDGKLTASANDSIIDDLSFRLAYKLSYDANGGTKKSTSQIGSKTDGTVKAIANTSDSLPAELVNGSFDYPAGLIAGASTKYPWDDWTVVDPINGRYARHIGVDKDLWAPITGWDASKFAWKSTQTKGTNWQQIAQGVELQKDSKTGNQYAELVAGQAGTALYQDIATIPGVSYRWELKHASLDRTHLDGMSVMIGEPGKESAQDATRTTVNGNGDQPGDVGKVISTKVRNKAELGGSSNHSSRNHDGQWETYTGTYIATGTVTRFTFKSVSSSNNVNGNILDDLSFTKAYRLGYDANGGAKTNASKISASSNGTVRLAATRTSVPSHALEDTDVPADYRSFTFDTTRTRLADARFDGNWTTTRDEAGGSIHWPTRLGASATLPNTGTWTDPDGVEHRINATIALKQWNGGNIGQLNRFDGNGKIVGDGLFWINVVYDNTKVPASVRKALGGIDTSKRVGCQWTVSFTYEDGTPVPSTFKGVTGFNDLDGFDARPDLKFEGVQLLSGFDGAYRTRDAELASYGTNGYAGIKHDAGDESNLNGAQQVRHRLAATWTGPTFTYSYDLENPTERTDGVRMTFGMPVTRTQVLTYKANGGTGQVPSRTEAGKTETAASRMNGTVRLAADRDTEPESGTTTDDRKVLTDTIARQDDGTSQRTITRSDGSVQVQTIADTGAVSGCQVYYPAGAKITLATAKADSDCWDSSQISKTNRTFYGWSANTDANDKDVPVADTMDHATLDANAETQITMPARAKTVYALWAINPTLTYNVNAPATTKAPDAPASMTVPYNTAADDKSGWTVGDTGKITGYSFDGWYTSPTGGDKYDWSTKLTNDVTMYAHWTANGYTVKYDAGGGKGTMGDQKFTFDVPQNLSPNAFTRDGYTFTGWKRADTGDSYTDGQQVSNLTSTPNGIVTMIAQWTPNPASINYDPNPPTGRTPGGQGTANWTGHTGDTQAIGANGWTVDGYTFAGWATSPDGGGTKYAPGASWTANGTLTLYAQWTPGEAGLTYDGNGATGGKTDPQPGKTDEKINVRDNGFTRDGYTFVTWNTQADCKGNAVKPNSEWTLRGSSTLYACWAGNAQTLTYHGNGATGGNTAAQSGKTGDELTTNANGFTRDGYTFVRWDTAKDGSGTAYGEGKNGVSQY
ncbi:InlB B-repeat-containing protein, partial [Bifidobacterium longum]|uniref:InlB B-repeat-containing protein n=1 Tax=Bifidobacterium longum TaxID=216816 RepID=UPI001F61C072